MQALHLKKGPEVGKAMKFLFDLQDDYAVKRRPLTKEIAKRELIKEFKKATTNERIISSLLSL